MTGARAKRQLAVVLGVLALSAGAWPRAQVVQQPPGGVPPPPTGPQPVVGTGFISGQVIDIPSRKPVPEAIVRLSGRFTIPAGASNHEVSTDVTFAQDATLVGLFPHTHVRGKRWSYTLELPDGTTKSILSVPRYDFNWQTYYMYQEPIAIPKGARILSTAWYDNSAANRSNPDPKIDVKWGDQTWEEMQYTGIMYSLKRQ